MKIALTAADNGNVLLNPMLLRSQGLAYRIAQHKIAVIIFQNRI